MSDEKKKGGFWSWFGLGKNKQEESEEPKEQASQEETNQSVQEAQPEAQETAEKTTALFDESNTEDVQPMPEFAEIQPEIPQPEEIVQPVPSADMAFESNQAIETLANSTALLGEETEAQAESAVEISDEFHEHKEESAVADMVETQEKPSEGGFFSRLLKGLVKTKQNIGAGFRSFFLGKKIDDDLFEELEEQLLIADIGVPTTSKIINNLTQHATRQQLQNADSLYQQLKLEMGEILKPVAQPLCIDGSKKPYVILMVGVNGVGKTTTIGKLARKFQMEGKSVMLAAGDTFRAAAVEQLRVWGERNHIPVVAQSTGSDSASVIFDAMQSAAARNIDILIADTAGRLQNKNNLMDELKKIVRVMKKYDESAPHEIMLTLDAGTGQNAISQAKLFHEAVGLTGISLTKLDGTAKGGVIFAIADQFNLPIRYIGVGEKIEDLREFNAEEFIEALFAHEEE
ncbi:signal recognition particle-docking protein FtsY [Aggregatibacter actinomycetemcomitans]|uniref:signal recognition particle-docking protein FtsY n=1 Tax=Aggregatibacter actinomycetemcomitans TaxID=714 RepID=UPI0006A6A4D2|nr:signal recognition particle-docking protein FtsY [Aggregatibacter actinomycetemcomitans]KOE64544.1 cell division protein FtsY [Aggregatibacter actinomycetemcomitans serotype e str. A160]KOE64746.1 cell division protein FtsY [Aggregatibacter actinomycetemcomitans serotype e str. SCC393]KYK73019.1 cell division protein FtsY [Aggregatibacter actinomycetemcomitans serotype e str. SA2876]